MAVLFGATALAALAVVGRLNSAWDSGIAKQWHEVDCGHTELPVDAVAWMKANHLSGRIFNRCEDGGYLQQEGFDQGQTFADTGFGKYDEDFIHEVGLVNERPALIPKFIAAYHPDFVVCGNLCYQWPYYLRTNGWRLIFYTPNSSVWRRPLIRPDDLGRNGIHDRVGNGKTNAATLPTISDDQIEAAFDRDLAKNGAPNPSLLGRNIIALDSLGLEDFAFVKLTGLPKADHHKSWYWEAARILCFQDPPFSAAHRDALMREAETAPVDLMTGEFRAYVYDALGDDDHALRILLSYPRDRISDAASELLAKIELDLSDPAALALARRADCWSLRNGKHWQYLAEAEERWGSLDVARAAWKKAVFYYPDDLGLMKAASDFAARHDDAALKQQIADSGKVYGAP
jgi:hypothetical protein